MFFIVLHERILNLHYHIQNIFRKGNDDTAEKCQKAVCSLRCVVRFKRKTYLHNTETEQNEADSLDCRKDKVRQAVYGCKRICGKYRA